MTTLNNCVCRPQSITLVSSSNNATFSRGYNVIVNNCYYSENLPGASGQGTAIGTMSNDDLVAALGDGWQIKDGKVIPGIMKYEYSSIEIPTFTNVTITATTPTEITPTGANGDGKVTFKGTYDARTFTSEDKSILFLGAENTLYWPLDGASIGAQRAYFQLNGIIAGSNAEVREFKLNFGDEDSNTTRIDVVDNGQWRMDNSNDSWYTLDGRKLNGEPTKKGMYIVNGKKVVIK